MAARQAPQIGKAHNMTSQDDIDHDLGLINNNNYSPFQPSVMDQRRVQIHHLNEQDLQGLFMEAQRKAKNRARRQLQKKKKKALKQLERERAEREALEEERRRRERERTHRQHPKASCAPQGSSRSQRSVAGDRQGAANRASSVGSLRETRHAAEKRRELNEYHRNLNKLAALLKQEYERQSGEDKRLRIQQRLLIREKQRMTGDLSELR